MTIDDSKQTSNDINRKLIKEFLGGNFEIPEISNELYSIKNWNQGMNKIIEDAKFRLRNNEIQL